MSTFHCAAARWRRADDAHLGQRGQQRRAYPLGENRRRVNLMPVQDVQRHIKLPARRVPAKAAQNSADRESDAGIQCE